MAETSRAALLCAAMTLLAGTALAQIDDDKVYNLSTAEPSAVAADTLAVEQRFEPRIEPGKFEFSLTLGFLGLNKTLLEHDRIIYKATSELFYYGDVSLDGDSAFTPFLYAGYNVNRFLAIEGHLGMSFSEYNAKIENIAAIAPEGGQVVSNPEFGDYDPEHRSVLGVFTNLRGVVYPLNVRGDGRGRWHPYLTGGVGVARYDIDSNYTDEPASSFNTCLGGGLRLIADDMISLRAELLYQVHTIEFTPAEYFDVRDDGTVRVPVYEFSSVGAYERVTSYDSQSLGGLAWSVGLTVSF